MWMREGRKLEIVSCHTVLEIYVSLASEKCGRGNTWMWLYPHISSKWFAILRILFFCILKTHHKHNYVKHQVFFCYRRSWKICLDLNVKIKDTIWNEDTIQLRIKTQYPKWLNSGREYSTLVSDCTEHWHLLCPLSFSPTPSPFVLLLDPE